MENTVYVHMPGGQLHIEIDKNYNVDLKGASICKITLSEKVKIEL